MCKKFKSNEAGPKFTGSYKKGGVYYSVVHQYNFAFKSLLMIVLFLPAKVSTNFILKYSVFMIPVGFCKLKITNVYQILTIVLKNVF